MKTSQTEVEERSLASLQAGVMSAVVFVVACFSAAIVFSAYPADARSSDASSTDVRGQVHEAGEAQP